MWGLKKKGRLKNFLKEKKTTLGIVASLNRDDGPVISKACHTSGGLCAVQDYRFLCRCFNGVSSLDLELKGKGTIKFGGTMTGVLVVTSHNGVLVTGGEDGLVCAFAIQTSKVLWMRRHDKRVTCLRIYSQDDVDDTQKSSSTPTQRGSRYHIGKHKHLLYTGSDDCSLSCWGLMDGTPIWTGNSMNRTPRPIKCVCISGEIENSNKGPLTTTSFGEKDYPQQVATHVQDYNKADQQQSQPLVVYADSGGCLRGRSLGGKLIWIVDNLLAQLEETKKRAEKALLRTQNAYKAAEDQRKQQRQIVQQINPMSFGSQGGMSFGSQRNKLQPLQPKVTPQDEEAKTFKTVFTQCICCDTVKQTADCSSWQQVAFCGGDDGRIYAVDQRNGEVLWANTGHEGSPCTVIAAAQGMVCSGSKHGEVCVWEAKHGQLKWRGKKHTATVRGIIVTLGISPLLVVSSGDDGTVQGWGLLTGRHQWQAGVDVDPISETRSTKKGVQHTASIISTIVTKVRLEAETKGGHTSSAVPKYKPIILTQAKEKNNTGLSPDGWKKTEVYDTVTKAWTMRGKHVWTHSTSDEGDAAPEARDIQRRSLEISASKRANTLFFDENGSSITLDGKPCVALKLQRREARAEAHPATSDGRLRRKRQLR